MATELERLKEQLANAEKREAEAKARAEKAKNDLKEKKKAKQALEKKLATIASKKERAARTKRLIELGAFMESLIGGEADLEMLKHRTWSEQTIAYFAKWKLGYQEKQDQPKTEE